MRKYTFALLWLLTDLFVPASVLRAQMAIHYNVRPPKAADSTDIAYYAPKHGFRAGCMTFGLNMGIWGFNRFIQKAEFAYINGRTIRDNLTHGFVWDNDAMGTNMFLHPYHGSLYFNSARSNGYNFWQSGLYAFGGSLMWELFMENEYPSKNDIMATPIGGLALGEVTYRIADLVLDDRQTGGNRFGLELSALLIAPTRGLTRLLSGDAWKRRSTSGKQFGVPEISAEISTGIRAIELKDDIFDRGIGGAVEINVEYGDRFDSDDKKPYDYFSFKSHLNIQKSQPMLGQLNIVGRLDGGDVVDDGKNYLSIGLYQHFDYYDSDTISDVSARIPYKFCTPASLGAGFIYRRHAGKRWDMDAFLHLNSILLGGALSDYYQVDNRNYNLASGYSSKSGMNFIYKKEKLSISTSYEVYHMFTWKGYPQDIDWSNIDAKSLNAQGDRSRAILHASELRLCFKLWKQTYLTSLFKNYTRKTKYKYYDQVNSSTSEGRLLLTWKL